MYCISFQLRCVHHECDVCSTTCHSSVKHQRCIQQQLSHVKWPILDNLMLGTKHLLQEAAKHQLAAWVHRGILFSVCSVCS
jgi:hypothetical protein